MAQNEISEFEQLIEQDPLLKSELNSQQQVIQGIQNYRQTQLKMRLDNIDVTPGLFETIASNTITQIATGVAITGSLVIGGYYLLQPNEKNQLTEISIEPKTIPFSSSKFQIEKLNAAPLVDIPELQHQEETVKEAIPESNPTTNETDVNKEAATLNPTIVSPMLADTGSTTDDNSIIVDVDNPTLPNQVNQEESIEVETVNDSKPDYRYKFSDNKLFLFGDFGGVPYEIIEINNRSGKRLFLYHGETYYRIHNSVTKISQLQSVTNIELINELNILRSNKSEQ